MFARPAQRRNPFRRLSALAMGLAALLLAACAQVTLPGSEAGGPEISRDEPVRVALLVPTSAPGGGGVVGQSLENAARLAAGDSAGRINLQTYDTSGTANGATQAAQRALNDGAQVILGPLYSQSISAITPLVAERQVPVLSFSNNPAVAGGNVYVLGQTFEDVASRLTSFARRQGLGSVAIVHADDVSGNAGRDAIATAAQSSGLRVATVQSYPLSQQGIAASAPAIGDAISRSGADTVFLTANVDADLPVVANALPANGVSPDSYQYMGLTRWSSAPEALSIPGLQGGLFTLPDQSALSAFESRYRAAYGSDPHPLGGLGYDAVSAIDALVQTGRRNALAQLTRSQGFEGAYGAFRLLPDGTNDRALAVAQVQNQQVNVLDPAPTSLGGGFGF